MSVEHSERAAHTKALGWEETWLVEEQRNGWCDWGMEACWGSALVSWGCYNEVQ